MIEYSPRIVKREFVLTLPNGVSPTVSVDLGSVYGILRMARYTVPDLDASATFDLTLLDPNGGSVWQGPTLDSGQTLFMTPSQGGGDISWGDGENLGIHSDHLSMWTLRIDSLSDEQTSGPVTCNVAIYTEED